MILMTKSLEDLSVSHGRHRLATYAILAFLVFLSFVLIVLVKTTTYNQASQGYKTNAQEMTGVGSTANDFKGDLDFVSYKLDSDAIKIPGKKGTLIINGSYTIDAWIKPRPHLDGSGSVDGVLVTKPVGIGGTYIQRPFQFEIESQGQVSLLFEDTQMKPSWGSLVTSKSTVYPNVWNHVAATVDATTGKARIYINGLLDGETNLNRPLTFNDLDKGVVIGASAGTAGASTGPGSDITLYRQHFQGEIDEVRISNVVRYSGDGFPLPQKPYEVDSNTLALYHFNPDYPFNDGLKDATGKNDAVEVGNVQQQVDSDLKFYLKNGSFELPRSNNTQPKVWEGKNLDAGDQLDTKVTLAGAGKYSYKFSPAKNGTEQLVQTIDHKGQDEAINVIFFHNIKGDVKKDSAGVVVKVQYVDSQGKKTTHSTSKTFSSAHGWTRDKLTLVTDKDKTYEWIKIIVFNNNPKDNSQYRVDHVDFFITSGASGQGLQTTSSSLSAEDLQLID